MSKMKKMVVMIVLVVAIVCASTMVHASTADLTGYIGTVHNINGMLYELPNAQKKALNDYASQLNDATADSVMADIMAAENLIRNSGVTNHTKLSSEQQNQLVAYAKSAASKAGANLEVNLSSRSYTLKTAGGKVLISGNLDSLVVDPGPAPSSNSAAAKTSSRTLLYTGANYILYVAAAVTVVGIAIAAKKRV